MALRIIAGKYRSRIIECPRKGVRPTTDRVKESVFSTLGPDLEESLVLDLFSGSGNLGIEALSRGAQHVIFVENNPHCAAVIKQNLAMLAAIDQTEVIIGDAVRYTATCNRRFDVIFVDPPYNKDLASTIAHQVYALLKEEGTAVIEHSPSEKVEMCDLQPWKTRCYGETVITYFKKETT